MSNTGSNPILDGFVVVTLDHAMSVAANRAKADGGDLRFVDGDCNALDFWVDHGLNTPTAKVWVKVPKILIGDTMLFALYGDPSATRSNDPALLFGSDIAALYPMTEGSGTVVHDPVGGFDLDLTGSATWTEGPRQGVYALTGFRPSGRANRTATQPTIGTGDFTVFSTVFSTASSTELVSQGILGTFTNSGAQGGWVMKLQGSGANISALLLTSQADGAYCQAGFRVTRNAWLTVGSKRASGIKSGYKDGAAVRFGVDCAGNLFDVTSGAPGSLKLGSYGVGTGVAGYAFEGKIAFTILYSKAKSDADMAALHNGLAMGSNLKATNGKEESALPGPGEPADGGVDSMGSGDNGGGASASRSGGCAVSASQAFGSSVMVCGALVLASATRRRRRRVSTTRTPT